MLSFVVLVLLWIVVIIIGLEVICRMSLDDVCLCGHKRRVHAVVDNHVLRSSHCTFMTPKAGCNCPEFRKKE